VERQAIVIIGVSAAICLNFDKKHLFHVHRVPAGGFCNFHPKLKAKSLDNLFLMKKFAAEWVDNRVKVIKY